jgi:signal transduction protein with GAF and PtsI domain
MRWLKWLGLAGLIGAAAVGVVVVQRRQARTWTDYEPDELRSRLHARLADATPSSADRQV